MAAFRMTYRRALIVTAVLYTTACGGGGDKSSPTVATPNFQPTPTASPYGVCAVTSASSTQPPSLTVQVIPEGDPLYGYYYECVKVFGVSHLAIESFPDEKLVHVATITAEYLDNNADGIPDDLASNASLERTHAVMILTNNAAERDAIHRLSAQQQDPQPLDYITAIQGQYTDETNAGGTLCGPPCGRQTDASLEEVLHLLQNAGYAMAHPNLDPNRTSLLTEAMDIARGGHFNTVPTTYPPSAWYHYTDVTCEYRCQATEYFYWGLTTLLGAQGDLHPARCQDIEQEWEPCTKAGLQATDTMLYALLTNSAYNLPTRLPDGQYR